jgi:hypothetical protein
MTGVRPVRARGSHEVDSIIGSPSARNTYRVRITRSPVPMPSRAAISGGASSCSLRDSQVPRASSSACSWRNGFEPVTGR